MGRSGSKVGSWVRASQSLPPYGIRHLRCGMSRRTQRRWPQITSDDASGWGVGLPLCRAPAYQETLCHTILEHLRNCTVHSDTQLALQTVKKLCKNRCENQRAA